MIAIKKEYNKMITKDELIARLNTFYSDMKTKLDDRPTMKQFRNKLTSIVEKMDAIRDDLFVQTDKLTLF